MGHHGLNCLGKVKIVLGWVTFLALDSLCTLSHLFHSIFVGISSEPNKFNQPCGNPGTCLCKDRYGLICLCPVEGVHLQKEARIIEGPTISIMPILGLHRPLPTRKWSNTITHLGGNIGVVFLPFLFRVWSNAGQHLSSQQSYILLCLQLVQTKAREVLGYIESVKILEILNPTGYMLTSSGRDAFIHLRYSL